MTCVTKLDKRAQKVLSHSVFVCALTAVIIGIVLFLLWGILYAINRTLDIEVIIISCAPVVFGIVLFVLYARQLKQADGTNSFNVYDFGRVMCTVKATRGGTFAGTLDIEYSQVKKVKERSGFILIYVNKLGAFIVDRNELGEYEDTLRADIAAAVN